MKTLMLKDKIITEDFETLQNKFIFVPVDKASGKGIMFKFLSMKLVRIMLTIYRQHI